MGIKLYKELTPVISHYLLGITELKLYDPEIIRLYSNESPLGPSVQAIEAYTKSSAQIHLYPDNLSSTLRNAIAKAHGLVAEYVICGAGITELLELIVKCFAGPGDEVLYSQYGFLLYPIVALKVGAIPITAPEINLKTDVNSILSYTTQNTKIVIIANPNNPTGSYLTTEEMLYLRKNLPENVLLIIDNAYSEYVEKEDFSDAIELVKQNPTNTIMLRSFSKIYGLAGLRLGWAYCDNSIIETLNTMKNPYSISNSAAESGIAALKDLAHIEASFNHNATYLSWITEQLQSIGLKVHPSVANFVLVEFPLDPKKNAEQADNYLKSNGIMVRSLERYALNHCIRLSIGKKEELEKVAQVLKEFMSF
ncbi:Histidinol-phosphate aminotransferase 2 [Rickettsiales bacterium Ac37b]|nr:Histidinol-phosphate aminotransferase 2 [Rickettsiales bacterium Ac37b]